MPLLHNIAPKLLAGIAIILAATMSFRAVADEQPRAPILIPNVQEPEEMRVAPFQLQNAVPTPDEGVLEETIKGALAKMLSGSPYEAISDFTEAIKSNGPELLKSKAYQGRADAYMQTREWDLAIRDLTTAISLQIGGNILIGSITQFRAIYPEYAAASDQAIAQKLNQTFYPDIKYKDFSVRFLTNRPLSSTALPELYVKRSDAYLRKGDWHSALTDFRRAKNGFPDYAEALDRWRRVGESFNTRSYVDMENFDGARDGSIKLSIKQTGGENVGGPYEVYRFELNCSAEKVRTLSWAEYNPSGTLIKSGEGGRWGSIWPDTLGKILEDGACSNSQPRAKPNEAG